MVAVAAVERAASNGGRRLALTSVFGDPLNPQTWSGAPNNLARALRRRGIEVAGIDAGPARAMKLYFAMDHLARGGGAPLDGNHVRRDVSARRFGSRVIASASAEHGFGAVLHTGTLDLPARANDSVRHYLYCDHTWALALRHRDDARGLSDPYLRRIDALERESYARLGHIFTFGDYVRDNLIEHYGVPAERITTVGSGMGAIAPHNGAKDYSKPRLLFVAKHLFTSKGGRVLLEAFRLLHRARPDTDLTVVAKNPPRAAIEEPGVTVFDFVPWAKLQDLYREATILTQPMLNDPWGQVYLEAMVSRTPPLGLARNGLPEIVEDGRHGFLVPEADPRALADSILDALSDPARLAAMGESGQRSVLARFSWERVAERIAKTIFTRESRAAPEAVA